MIVSLPLVTSRRGRWVALVLLIAGAVAWTYIDASPPRSLSARPVVATRSSTRYGEILVTRGGYALYTYRLDSRDHSDCRAFCLQMWPPLTVPAGQRPTGSGVTGLGTITTAAGEHQVTYDGKPLYLYVLDHAPGRVTGQGNDWSVVRVTTN